MTNIWCVNTGKEVKSTCLHNHSSHVAVLNYREINDLQINIDQGGKVLLTPGELFSAGRRLRFRLKTRDHISHSENLEYIGNISRGRSKLWLPQEGWTVACWWRELQQCLWMVGTGTPEQFSSSFPHRFYRLFPKPEFSIQLLKELLHWRQKALFWALVLSMWISELRSEGLQRPLGVTRALVPTPLSFYLPS